jgi:hypothetical protein
MSNLPALGLENDAPLPLAGPVLTTLLGKD